MLHRRNLSKITIFGEGKELNCNLITFSELYRASKLNRFSKQLPPNQHTANFAGASADFVEFGIAQ